MRDQITGKKLEVKSSEKIMKEMESGSNFEGWGDEDLGGEPKGRKYQCWMRNWETMEYVAIYVTARSTVEVSEVVNKHFRSTHQLKSIISEDEGFIPEVAGLEV